MTPTTGAGGERCARCGRDACKPRLFAAREAMNAKPSDEARRELFAAIDDCDLHVTDWMARAHAAEAALRATAAPVGVTTEEVDAIRKDAADTLLAYRADGGWILTDETAEAERARWRSNAAATLRLLDAHAALVSHGDGVAAQLVEVTHKATRAALVAIVELDGIACGNNAPCVGPVERAIDALLALVPDDGEEEFDAKRSLAALDATRTPVPPPGDTPDGGAR